MGFSSEKSHADVMRSGKAAEACFEMNSWFLEIYKVVLSFIVEVSLDDLVVLAKVKHPFPFRTGP